MLRNLFAKTASNGFNISNNPVCVQSVRWRRKPRWLPTAKSKMFKVPERHILPPEEIKEWLRLNQNYKAQMRSVRAFFREEVERKKIIVAQALTPADEEAEFQRCSAINAEWNFEISKRRDARLIQENAERREYILGRLELKKIRDREELEKIEARVRQEKVNSATFITRDNIDKAIEHALANQADYNFSVDLQGNIYRGNERPGSKKEGDSVKPVESEEAEPEKPAAP